jgi:hypothetical protein
MFVTLITDCSDDNAMNRQASRFASYFGTSASRVGVSFYAEQGSGEIEGAGNLIDTLDATDGRKGVIVVNTAHRDGKGKKWPNGTPFGYFYHKKTLVIATIDGYCLSLAKKLKLTDTIHLLDVPTVIDTMIKQGHHKEKYRRLVVDSQFRSFEFVPRVANWLMKDIELPFEKYPITEVPDAPNTIWHIDNFGNTVTTLLPEEINHAAGKKITTVYGDIACYERLKDVPNGEPGLIVGSWGIYNNRWISLVIQGKSAEKHYNIKTGTPLFKS